MQSAKSSASALRQAAVQHPWPALGVAVGLVFAIADARKNANSKTTTTSQVALTTLAYTVLCALCCAMVGWIIANPGWFLGGMFLDTLV